MTVTQRIQNYLDNGGGGLFNPELMDHAKVRALLVDVLADLASLKAELHAEHDTTANDPAEQRAERYAAEANDLTGRLIKAEAELVALKAERAWQPIESGAFGDGDYVLGFAEEWVLPDIVQYFAGTWMDSGGNDCRPTHWMPLPPPASSGKE